LSFDTPRDDPYSQRNFDHLEPHSSNGFQ